MGTLRVPEVVPSPKQDAERLRQSFEGLGTDEKAVIWVLGHRNASQRKIIRDAYQELYNESLLDRLNSELSGDFRNAVMLWTSDPPERDAKLANEALKAKKKGINHLQVIVEIACASPPDHLMAVRQAYCSLFQCSLEEDIASSVSPQLRKVLEALVSSYRTNKEVVDSKVTDLEATKLHGAIQMKQLDHDDVVWILGTRNFFQLSATFRSYKQKFGSPIDQDIKSCGNGDLESLLGAVILCIDSPEKHFAKVIRTSIVGLGTDEDSLNRAIVTRAEIDMKKIKSEYLEVYKTSIEDDIKGDTSGDYKDFLLTLIGARI